MLERARDFTLPSTPSALKKPTDLVFLMSKKNIGEKKPKKGGWEREGEARGQGEGNERTLGAPP